MLSGRRILITRAPHQASELAERLRGLGASPIQIAAIEIAAPSSYGSLDAALAELATFDVVAFTSANAVDAFQRRALHLDFTPVARRIAAVGPGTEAALRSIGLRADVLPAIFTAEALAEKLRPEARGRSFLLVLGEEAAPTLHDALVGAGATVRVAAAYSNRIPAGSLPAIASLFAQPSSYPDAVTFTSASTVNNLVALLKAAQLELPEAVVRASIGPVTSRALRAQDLPPHLEAAESTIPALVECLAAHFRSAGPKLY
jgi:uroporphyrinogen-III synthase